MRTDGQTDKTKLTVAFRNFAKAPTKTCPSLKPTAEPNLIAVLSREYQKVIS